MDFRSHKVIDMLSMDAPGISSRSRCPAASWPARSLTSWHCLRRANRAGPPAKAGREPVFDGAQRLILNLSTNI